MPLFSSTIPHFPSFPFPHFPFLLLYRPPSYIPCCSRCLSTSSKFKFWIDQWQNRNNSTPILDHVRLLNMMSLCCVLIGVEEVDKQPKKQGMYTCRHCIHHQCPHVPRLSPSNIFLCKYRLCIQTKEEGYMCLSLCSMYLWWLTSSLRSVIIGSLSWAIPPCLSSTSII